MHHARTTTMLAHMRICKAHVDYLIREATSEQNLSNCYSGCKSRRVHVSVTLCI